MDTIIVLILFLIYDNTARAGSPIQEYTDNNFENNIKDHKLAVVYFYSPDCPYCQNFTPQYEDAKAKLDAENVNAAWIKVSCPGDGKEICRKYGVTKVPAVKAFKSGEVQGSLQANGQSIIEDIKKYTVK